MTNTVTKTTLLSLVICLCLISGCVERKLTIRTSPDNAQVMLNDEPMGTSPVTASFQWYGDYSIRINKPGYIPLETHRKLKAPWYDYFPFDFFAQILTPKRIVNEYEWSFDLEPAQPVDRDTVIGQAQTLQDELQAQSE